MRQIGIIGAALVMSGLLSCRCVEQPAIRSETPAPTRRRTAHLGRRQRNFGIVHVVSPKPETKRTRRRRLGRERGVRRLAFAQHLARCGK